MQNPAPTRRRLWPVFVMPGLVVVLAIGWSVFWYVASSEIGRQFDGWQAREAKAGRIYKCGDLSVGGYPFRFEVSCANASASLAAQTASQAPIEGRVARILAVAQVYNPKLLIAEFTAPATIAAARRAIADRAVVAGAGQRLRPARRTAADRAGVRQSECRADRVVGAVAVHARQAC